MNEKEKLYDCGGVKRADLRLRIKYYGLKTKIYLIEQCHYVIQITNYLEMYEEIQKDFDRNIRALGDWVEIVKDAPASTAIEVEKLKNIAYKNEGIFLTHQLLVNLLVSKFSNVEFIDVSTEHINGVILTIAVCNDTALKDMDAIKQFVANLKSGYTEIKVKKESSIKQRLYDGDVGLACTDKNYKFSVLDSEFWFDNVEKIYAREIKKADLRFYDKSKTKCYLDFSVWGNENINIRSNVLLYDTVYISFPLGEHIDNFLEKQKLTIQDIEELVERKKLIVLLPNTESRYDKKIINRLFQINNDSVVSKRGINALMAIAYCELEQKYLSFWQGNESILESICMECIKSNGKRQKELLQWLLWPIKAKMESYELLTSYGPMKLPSIGANQLFEYIYDDTERSESIKFELTVNSNPIHIASALQATYFPFCMSNERNNYSDTSVANILGSVINSYQYFPEYQQENIDKYTNILAKERNALYLLNTTNTIELKHVLDYAQKYNTTHTLKSILNNLTQMKEDERSNKIIEYNNLIAEIGKEKIHSTKTGLSYILTGAGFVPGIGTAASIVSLIIQIFNDLKIKNKVVEKKILTNTSSIQDEVYWLDKISRVARIESR